MILVKLAPMGYASPLHPRGLQLTKQLKCGPSSLAGERHKGMSGPPSAT